MANVRLGEVLRCRTRGWHGLRCCGRLVTLDQPVGQSQSSGANHRRNSALYQQAGMVDHRRTAVVWFRNDLRLADHEPLTSAIASSPDTLLPLFCLDTKALTPRQQQAFKLDCPQFGPHKARFLLESIRSLAADLEAMNSQLLTFLSPPEDAIKACIQQLAQNCTQVDLFYHQQVGSVYEQQEDEVIAAGQASAHAQGASFQVHPFWGATLYHVDQLATASFSQPKHTVQQSPPNSASSLQQACWHIPRVMTDFRKAMERDGRVREPLSAPASLPPLPEVLQQLPPLPDTVRGLYEAAGALQHVHALEQLCGWQLCNVEEIDARSAMPFRGGAVEGVRRLHYFVHGCSGGADGQDEERVGPISSFKELRMTAPGVDNSAKLSAYHALGCLSPRQVHAAAQALVHAGGSAAEGAACLHMHLIIRDFFMFAGIKAGDSMLEVTGLAHKERDWQWDEELFGRWARGETGFPFVDACMRELATTGYMSNRGRQNVASFLTKELKLDWRAGAQLFESLLIDDDYAVNYANWNYFGGVGNDPRDRTFRTVSQGIKYDPDAKLVKAWIPELRPLSCEEAHMPWTAAEEDQARIYTSYCRPIVDPASQLQH